MFSLLGQTRNWNNEPGFRETKVAVTIALAAAAILLVVWMTKKASVTKPKTAPPSAAPSSPSGALQEEAMSDHLVRVHIPLAGEMTTPEEFHRYAVLEDRLDAAAQAAKVGELDGNEVGGGEFTIWLYGKDGTRLAEVIKSALAKETLPRGCTIFVRHGGVNDPSARDEILKLD